jgi:hypothetical protein
MVRTIKGKQPRFQTWLDKTAPLSQRIHEQELNEKSMIVVPKKRSHRKKKFVSCGDCSNWVSTLIDGVGDTHNHGHCKIGLVNCPNL